MLAEADLELSADTVPRSEVAVCERWLIAGGGGGLYALIFSRWQPAAPSTSTDSTVAGSSRARIDVALLKASPRLPAASRPVRDRPFAEPASASLRPQRARPGSR